MIGSIIGDIVGSVYEFTPNNIKTKEFEFFNPNGNYTDDSIWGQGEGLQGQSYAIPTMEGIAEMSEAIRRFTSFAAEHPELRFLVTRIGCGIAGYSAGQVAPLFKECIPLENVALPFDFWEVLGLKM